MHIVAYEAQKTCTIRNRPRANTDQSVVVVATEERDNNKKVLNSKA